MPFGKNELFLPRRGSRLPFPECWHSPAGVESTTEQWPSAGPNPEDAALALLCERMGVSNAWVTWGAFLHGTVVLPSPPQAFLRLCGNLEGGQGMAQQRETSTTSMP